MNNPQGIPFGALLALAGLSVLLPRPSMGQSVSFDDAMEVVLNNNLRALESDLRLDETQSQALRAGARYYPGVRVEANTQVWDDALTLNLGGGTPAELPAPQTPYEELLAGLVTELGQPVPVRDQLTAQAQISIVQPLVGLYPIHLASQLEQRGVEAARLERDVTDLSLLQQTSAVYLRVLLTERLLENAQTSRDTLLAQEKRTQALIANAAAIPADALRLRVAIADAEREIIRLENAKAITLSQLAALMNLDLNAPLELTSSAPSNDVPPPQPPLALDEATARGLAQRPQVALVTVRGEQAELGVELAQTDYLPSLDLIGAYQRTEGQGLVATDQLFVGLFLTWDVVAWGARVHQVDAAQSRVEQVEVAQAQLRQAIALEVRSAWLEMESARRAWDVAQTAVREAQEVYRTEQVRFEQQASTAVDLLTAESALTQARNARSITRYNVLLALVQLRAAMGDPPTANNLNLSP
ncbi:MAG: TolC family protein [Myxococcota bacterium]